MRRLAGMNCLPQHENCGKSIFHFLLGPGLHLCRGYRRDSSRSSKAFKKRAASRPSWLNHLDRMTSGLSSLKASASRQNTDASVPGASDATCDSAWKRLWESVTRLRVAPAAKRRHVDVPLARLCPPLRGLSRSLKVSCWLLVR